MKDEQPSAGSRRFSSSVGKRGNNVFSDDDDDDDTKSARSRRSSSSRRGSASSRGPKLYDPTNDYPSLTPGIPSSLLKLRADVEASLATVLLQQTKTKNDLYSMALELAEAKELINENEELRQLLQEGEDKDVLRKERKVARKEEKDRLKRIAKKKQQQSQHQRSGSAGSTRNATPTKTVARGKSPVKALTNLKDAKVPVVAGPPTPQASNKITPRRATSPTATKVKTAPAAKPTTTGSRSPSKQPPSSPRGTKAAEAPNGERSRTPIKKSTKSKVADTSNVHAEQHHQPTKVKNTNFPQTINYNPNETPINPPARASDVNGTSRGGKGISVSSSAF
eukprot:GILI01011164.1.p1 GENE.GILI01011164.1~~GILI01011164.1.p1  ORF type:complete len:337 (+),score=78.39 GILI01011164.1:694-1704(+)